MRKVFVSAPLNAPTQDMIEENIRFAEKCGNVVRAFDMYPIIPHQLARFLDDNNQEERAIGVQLSLNKMKECDYLIAYQQRVTAGMLQEIVECGKLGIPVLYFDDLDDLIDVLYSICDDLEDDEYKGRPCEGSR